MLCTLPEYPWTCNFENYNRVVAALLICEVPLFLVQSVPSTHNINIEYISPHKHINRLDLMFILPHENKNSLSALCRSRRDVTHDSRHMDRYLPNKRTRVPGQFTVPHRSKHHFRPYSTPISATISIWEIYIATCLVAPFYLKRTLLEKRFNVKLQFKLLTSNFRRGLVKTQVGRGKRVIY